MREIHGREYFRAISFTAQPDRLPNNRPIEYNALQTRKALGRTHVPPTKVCEFLKPRLVAVAAGRQYVYMGFSRRKIPPSSAYTISEKAIRFRHLDHNPDRAQKLISSSMSRHLSTRNISSKSMHAFLNNLANRQTDKQTNTRAKTFTSSFVGGNDSHMHM